MMNGSLQETLQRQHETMCALYQAPLRATARRAVRVWFNRERLDRVLLAAMSTSLSCDLLYAIDGHGHQVSSNIYQQSIDRNAHGQDLSRRPYVVTMPLLSNAAHQGAFLCDEYTSQASQRPCVTVMCGVTSGPTTLGFIAADLELDYPKLLRATAPKSELTAALR